MPFMSSGSFTTFTANTKAKSAEVNANFAVGYNFFNTITSEILIGSAWQKIANTTAGYTFSTTDGIRTLLINRATSGASNIVLPVHASNTHRIIDLINTASDDTSTSLGFNVVPTTTALLDNTTGAISVPPGGSVSLHCDGTTWRTINAYKTLTRQFKVTRAISSAGYAFGTAHDGVDVLLITTGASDRNVDLPDPVLSGSNHVNRIITVKKADSGAGKVTITPPSGTIDGAATYTLYSQYDFVTLQADATNWNIIAVSKLPSSQVSVTGGNGHGSTNTKIRRFTSSSTVGTAITYADSAANGGSFTINEDGVYTISYRDAVTGAGSGAPFGITVNSAELTTNITSAQEADVLMLTTAVSADQAYQSAVTFRASATQIVRAHTNGGVDATDGSYVKMIITQVARL